MKMFYLAIGVMFIAASDCQPIITAFPEYLCLGDSVQLTCSAQGSATWGSDDILGRSQSISFDGTILINTSRTVGNGIAVLLETSPRIVTSLSFNLTADRVETRCADSQDMIDTTRSSVQPSPNGNYSVRISGGSITWGPPSNIDDFLLQNYQLTIECNGRVVDGVNTTELRNLYNAERLIPGLCSATVTVINSCGATASNSIIFPVVSVEGNNTVTMVVNADGDSNTGLIIGLSIGLGVAVVVIIVLVIVIVVQCYNKNKKNKKKEGSQGFTQPIDGDEKPDNQYSL